MQVHDEAELSSAIAGANGPLRIAGGGTRTLATVGDVLDISGLRGIELYEPGALTMVAKAGTPVAEIEKALSAEAQRLAFEPYFLRKGPSTIGGVMAANASGPRRVQVGAARDFLLGARFVDGLGQIIQNGGRVMKNVTGYDLVKLMAGSRGQLGALSEVSFKVLPRPETEGTLLLHGLDEVKAVAAMSKALGSPFEVSGASHGLVGPEAVTSFRVEGMAGSVQYRLEQVTNLVGEFGEVERLSEAESVAHWQAIRDVTALADCPCLVRMSFQPSDFPKFYHSAGELFFHDGRPDIEVMLDWGGGCVWLGASNAALDRISAHDPLENLDTQANGARVLHDFAQSFCAMESGHATLMRAPAETLPHVSVTQPETRGVAALTSGLRAKFDPKGIFAPGLSA